MSKPAHDFIIVGAGAAGCALAWRLANSRARPTVLLLEAGGPNTNPAYRIDGDRYVLRLIPELTYGYKTVPQTGMGNREIDYQRGKGLGGSTGVNFCVWNVGPKDDFEEIKRLTGNDLWGWENSMKLLKELENYRIGPDEAPRGFDKYLKVDPEKHGKKGPLKVGYPRSFEPCITHTMDVFEEAGFKLNLDMGTGDNMGTGLCPNTAYKGSRTTGADLLVDPPENLTIITNAQTHRLIFNGKKAKGVQLIDGTIHVAAKEVILSAGSLDTPKILMLSGIGPRDQLTKFDIPVLHENANVGQNLRDHYHISATWRRKEGVDGRHAYIKDPENRVKAIKQWENDKTGPLADIMTQMAIGFFKSDAVLSSPEFEALPEDEKRHLKAPTTPSFELGFGGPCEQYFVDPVNTPLIENIWVFLLNSQARGSVTLQSADPEVPMVFDPKLLSHPFDKRVAIESVREMMKVAESHRFLENIVGPLSVPNSSSDADILKFWEETSGSTWHMTGTCKMGRREVEDGAVVGPDFKLFGIEGLRVADMSIVPILPNNHTVTTAYISGLVAAQVIATEYGLD